MEYWNPQKHFYVSRGKLDECETVSFLATKSSKEQLRDWTGAFATSEFLNTFGNYEHRIGIEEFLHLRKLVPNRCMTHDKPPLTHSYYSQDDKPPLKHSYYSQDSTSMGSAESEEIWVEKEKADEQNQSADYDDDIDVENSSPPSPAFEENDGEDYQRSKMATLEENAPSPIMAEKESNMKRGYETHHAKSAELHHSRFTFNPLPIRKKSKKKHVPAAAKDQDYWRQRIKNNIAARISREDRRRKEIELVMKCESLLLENWRLRHENGILLARAKVMEVFAHTKKENNF